MPLDTISTHDLKIEAKGISLGDLTCTELMLLESNLGSETLYGLQNWDANEVLSLIIDPTHNQYRRYYAHQEERTIVMTFDPESLWRAADNPNAPVFYNWIHLGGYPESDLGNELHICSLMFAIRAEFPSGGITMMNKFLKYRPPVNSAELNIRIGPRSQYTATTNSGRRETAQSVDLYFMAADTRWDDNSNDPQHPARVILTKQ